MTKELNVTGIGNAMVDILARCDDAFLVGAGVDKGIMQLIDMDRAVDLYGKIGPAREVSGGSAANTIAVIAALGGSTAYVGKVKDDQLGHIFAHDMRAIGGVYETPLAPENDPQETGRCIVLVTPDGERSMNTYLGVTEHLTADDIDPEQIAKSEWIYLEGYRFDGPESHAAFAKAIDAAKGAGTQVSLTLSDPFCVSRHRDAFRKMIVDGVDLLFCNRAELLSMYETEDFDAALKTCGSEVSILACTDSENGAYVVANGEITHVGADPVDIVDATGAGDAFAGAFLYGITHGADLATCARMGNLAAGSVIAHIGPRPEADLKALFKDANV
ncbi:adenosine kinase [Pseudaestuariivita sp.]|uniref:adenosine kinase n=1 Tax=Pseudaestuariivita sp. TaxID=2211669 RepID=UPI00405917DD